MRWLCSELSWDVRSLLEKERSVAALSASTRARAVARAREALTSKAAAALLPSGLPGLGPSMAIVGLIGLAGAVGGLGAFVLATRVSSSSVVTAARAAEAPAADDSAGLPVAPAMVEVPPSDPAAPSTDDGREEMRLLELARARLANKEFAAAMSPLAEHARRFRQGRLAEEREALRLKALSGLGRRDEVRRGAAAFEARFPRSPLVAAVRRMASSAR